MPGSSLDSPADPSRRRAILLTGHYYASRRKANFHFLAESLARQGWDVVFVTTQISPVSRWRGDLRFDYPVREEANRPVLKAPNLTSYVWYTPFHVFHLRSDLLDRLSSPLFGLYARLPLGGLEPLVRGADLIMVESCGALMLTERLHRLNPRARLVYRVSDDVRNLGQHRLILEAEMRAAPLFDLISAPSRYTVDRFRHLSTVHLHPHGIDGAAFDEPVANPYQPGVNLVSVGNSFFDPDFIPAAAAMFPDWTFHVIGRVPAQEGLPNVRWLGEMPFAETIGYIRHADVGLAPYLYRPGAETLADSSLKLNQYTWCRVPAVTPDFATRADRPHVFGYRPGDPVSIREALQRAMAFPHARVSRSGIRSWDELARLIACPAEAEQANDNLVELRRRR